MAEVEQLQDIANALMGCGNLKNYQLWVPLYLLVTDDQIFKEQIYRDATPLQVCAVEEIVSERSNIKIVSCCKSIIIEGLSKVVQIRDDVTLKNSESALETTRKIFRWSLLEGFWICNPTSDGRNKLKWYRLKDGNFVATRRHDIYLEFPDPLPIPRLSEDFIDFQLCSMMMITAPQQILNIVKILDRINHKSLE
jgi:hypothetical protein